MRIIFIVSLFRKTLFANVANTDIKCKTFFFINILLYLNLNITLHPEGLLHKMVLLHKPTPLVVGGKEVSLEYPRKDHDVKLIKTSLFRLFLCNKTRFL